ncbi:MAG: response regulator transcription factor [Marinifilaceae bacterium]|jgi:DNA-binding response OmpR family regulator|nr:response regulator transcription factor [Marinifilaceae bacterium]
MNKILIIEDEINIANGISNLLSKYGFEVSILVDFEHIDKEVKIFEPHLILMDINLPYFDGFYWCAVIRKISFCPIIMVSARNTDLDQVIALDNGADEYVTKPFNNEVLIAKIKSLLRRTYGDYVSSNDFIEIHGLTIDTSRLLMSFQNKEVILTNKELILLRCLVKNHEKVVSREILLEKVWDNQSFVEDNTLNVNIARIRKKLENLGLENVLETVRGFGYRLSLNMI